MTNFELKIIPAGEKRMVLLAESIFGEVVTQMDETFFLNMVERSQELRMIYGLSIRRDRAFQKEVEDATSEFGEELFKGVFRDKILSLFNRTIGGSVNGQLNLRLMLGKPGLNSIQWEIMRFRNEYIGFKHNLIRHPFAPYPVKSPNSNERSLRVLIVSVDPFFPETVDQEHRDTIAMLKGLGNNIELIELFQDKATLENIKEVLFGGVDIWQFTGHGMFDARNPLDSSLIVWGERGEKYSRLSVRLLSTLAINQNLGFCFLNACDTGRSVGLH